MAYMLCSPNRFHSLSLTAILVPYVDCIGVAYVRDMFMSSSCLSMRTTFSLRSLATRNVFKTNKQPNIIITNTTVSNCRDVIPLNCVKFCVMLMRYSGFLYRFCSFVLPQTIIMLITKLKNTTHVKFDHTHTCMQDKGRNKKFEIKQLFFKTIENIMEKVRERPKAVSEKTDRLQSDL